MVLQTHTQQRRKKGIIFSVLFYYQKICIDRKKLTECYIPYKDFKTENKIPGFKFVLCRHIADITTSTHGLRKMKYERLGEGYGEKIMTKTIKKIK